MTDAQIKPYSPPWYEALPHAVTDWWYGPNANAQQGEWVRKLTGPENPFNLPGQIAQGVDTAAEGVRIGDPARALAGGAQAVLGLAPAASPSRAALANALRRPHAAAPPPMPAGKHPLQPELPLPGEPMPHLPMDLPRAPVADAPPALQQPGNSGSPGRQLEMPFPGRQEEFPLDARLAAPVKQSRDIDAMRDQYLATANEAWRRLKQELDPNVRVSASAHSPNGGVYMDITMPGHKHPLSVRIADHAQLEKKVRTQISLDPSSGNTVDDVVRAAQNFFGKSREPVEIGWSALPRSDIEHAGRATGGRAIFDVNKSVQKPIRRNNYLFSGTGGAMLAEPYLGELARQLAPETRQAVP